MQFREIHIGFIINQIVTENGIKMSRICNFFKCQEEEIEKMYHCESMDSNLLLRWSKLLGYDFFRIYTHHLILYSPPKKWQNECLNSNKKSKTPQFRKNIYTKEIIDFILELLETGEKNKQEIISQYKIPKTTLYKWIKKYTK
ncbi:transposase [Chryseobacterium sp. EZn1]